MRTLDHKVIEIIRDVPLSCIETAYLAGRKAHRCQHVTADGVLPHALETKGAVRLRVSITGEVEHETRISLDPGVFVCANCLLSYLIDELRPGSDLAADRR